MSYLKHAARRTEIGNGYADTNVESFWIFLEDVGGNKMVWDQTSTARTGVWPANSTLPWADAGIPDGFRLEAVRRLVLSVQEPDPPVHVKVTVHSDRILLQ